MCPLTILSGFQPSGKLHLGNYFGAIKPLLDFQKGGKNVYCLIADYHSITSSHDPAILKQNIENMALDLRALGVEKIFFQSAIPEILELYWILSSVIPVSYLERCHAYKDKISKGQTPSLALFSYPILMAADILLFEPDLVPIGQDQVQHFEIVEELIKKFQSRYSYQFQIPEKEVFDVVVPGTDGQKMSKTYNNTIPIFDSEIDTRKACSKIVTDSKGINEPKDPNSCNIFKLYSLVEPNNDLKISYEEGLSYGSAKGYLANSINAYFWKQENVK